MNYGRRQTRLKIRAVNSKSQKYANKVGHSLFQALFIFILFAAVTGTSVGFGMLRGILDSAPKLDPDSVAPSGFITTVYDSKGNPVETLVGAGANRIEATYDELPQDLINAFVAIEDSRFWQHGGIDFRSITRAAVGVLTDDYKGGGSTITQQLIKNTVFDGGMETSFGARLERKFQEQYLALQLTKTMDRKIIITNYLNTINLGSNTLGVKAAAKRYFNKDVSELTLSECAVIAGITQNPGKLNPISGAEANAERRRVILQEMYDQKYIDKDEMDEALADDVYSRIQNVDILTRENNSHYSYFTDELISQVTDALVNELGYTNTQAQNLLFSGGLEIYTTQDPDIQAIVDEEINDPSNYDAARYSVEYRLSVTHENGETEHFSEENLRAYEINVQGNSAYDGLFDSEEAARTATEQYKAYQLAEGDTVIGESFNTTLQPQTSFVLMDQATGYVKAISGGRGEKKGDLTLNRATDTVRQPGSAFKVLASFAPALDSCGATLGTVYYDTSYTVGDKTFKNWYENKGFLGYHNIREGIIYSMNIIAARCMVETVTPQLGIEYAENMGISTLVPSDITVAAALGGLTYGVTNLEMTGAFAAIANGGMYTKPIFFTRILDHNGKILIDNTAETKRVLKDSTAFLLTDAMADSVEANRIYAREGVSVSSTSAAAAIPGMSTAGKSGTTTANNDIWFVGYTPYYTAGIWGGCDNNQKLGGQNGGTSFHKRIWRSIMERVHEGLSDPGFTVPSSVETAEICRKSGKLAIPDVCSADPRGSAVYTEYFAKGTVPTEMCDHHVRATICSVSGGAATEYCPESARISKTFMTIPAEEKGDTDDTHFVLPEPCTVHTSSGTSHILNPNGSTLIDPLGPGYTPTEGAGSPGGQRSYYTPPGQYAPTPGGSGSSGNSGTSRNSGSSGSSLTGNGGTSSGGLGRSGNTIPPGSTTGPKPVSPAGQR